MDRTRDVLVVDLGSLWLRCGLNNTAAPTVVMKNVVGRKHGSTEEVVGSEDATDLVYPISRGVVRDWKALKSVLDLAFKACLPNTNDRTMTLCLITVPPFSTREYCKGLVNWFFEEFQFAGMFVSVSSLLNSYHLSGERYETRTSGIYVDFGAELVTIVPVCNGYVLPCTVKQIEFGGEDITRFRHEDMNVTVSSVRETKERLDLNESILQAHLNLSVLQPRRLTLANHIADSISHLPLELRKESAISIILVGGGSTCIGLAQALQDSIVPQLESKRLDIVPSIQHGTWIGGMLLSRLPEFHEYCFSRVEFESDRKNILESSPCVVELQDKDLQPIPVLIGKDLTLLSTTWRSPTHLSVLNFDLNYALKSISDTLLTNYSTDATSVHLYVSTPFVLPCDGQPRVPGWLETALVDSFNPPTFAVEHPVWNLMFLEDFDGKDGLIVYSGDLSTFIASFSNSKIDTHSVITIDWGGKHITEATLLALQPHVHLDELWDGTEQMKKNLFIRDPNNNEVPSTAQGFEKRLNCDLSQKLETKVVVKRTPSFAHRDGAMLRVCFGESLFWISNPKNRHILSGEQLEPPRKQLVLMELDSTMIYVHSCRNKDDGEHILEAERMAYKFMPISFNEHKLIIAGNDQSGKSGLLRSIVRKDGGNLNIEDLPRENLPPVSFERMRVRDWSALQDNPISPSIERRTLNIWTVRCPVRQTALHQCFLSETSVLILVFDMCKVEGKNERQGEIEYIKNWLASASLLPYNPLVLLVGTHKDVVSTIHRLRYIEKQLNKHLLCKFEPNICLQKNGELSFWPIDNTAFGPEVENLQEAIDSAISSRHCVPSGVPIDWIANWSRNMFLTRLPYITLEDAMNLAPRYILQRPQRMRNALSFLHDRGLILSFSQPPSLSGIVVLDPRWLSDFLGRVVTPPSNELIRDCPRQYHEFSMMKKEGIFGEGLAGRLWNPPNEIFAREFLFSFMEHTLLAFEWNGGGGDGPERENGSEYLVPLILRRPHQSSKNRKTLEVLQENYPLENHGSMFFIDFGDNVLPNGLFELLLCHVAQHNQEPNKLQIAKAVQDEEVVELDAKLVGVEIQSSFRITELTQENRIRVIPRSKTFCQRILGQLEESLTRIDQVHLMGLKYKIVIQSESNAVEVFLDDARRASLENKSSVLGISEQITDLSELKCWVDRPRRPFIWPDFRVMAPPPPPPPLEDGKTYHAFFSHHQSQSGDICCWIAQDLQSLGFKVFLDMKVTGEDRTVPNMLAGVQSSLAVFLFLTEDVMNRTFVQMELDHAIANKIPIHLLHDEEIRRMSYVNLAGLREKSPERYRDLLLNNESIPLRRREEERYTFLNEIIRKIYDSVGR